MRTLSAAGVSLLAPAALFASPESDYAGTVVPLLRKYCYECHGDGIAKAGLALDEFKTVADVHRARKHFEAVLRNVTRHEMPPGDAAEFPTEPERETIARFLERELFQLDPARPDPGRVTLRRLNRAEYGNAIRDVVGVESNPAAEFPPDDSGYGFDNIADVLSLPPLLMEKYFAAAEQVLDSAIVTDPIQSRVHRVPASLAKIGFNAVGDRGDGWVHLISLEEDDVAVELPFVAAGDYLVRFHAYATKTGGALVGQGSDKPIEFKEDPGPTRIAVALNEAFVTDFAITTDAQAPQTYEARLGIPAGRQTVRVVMRRKRGGDNELTMLNGRLGKQQPGIVFVRWVEIEGPLPAATQRMPAARLDRSAAARNIEGGHALEKNGEVAMEFQLERAAEVILRAQAFADQAGDEPARMEFRVDGQTRRAFAVRAPGHMKPLPKQRVFSPQLLLPQPEIYETRAALGPGRHRFSAAFVNAHADPECANPNLRQRRLVVQHLEVADLSSPVPMPPLPPPLAELFAREGAGQDHAAARRIVAAFARRAWRRAPIPAEVDRLLELYQLSRDDGETFAAAVKLAFKAVLVSPHFLFVGEIPATGDAGSSPLASEASTVPLGELALASRLSFFLWSSVPDEALLALAEQGRLRANYAAQVRRLLASPKAEALVRNFATQWLELRKLENLQPDRKQFPEFDAALRGAMQRETELLFQHVMREDRSVFDFLEADYTFVNARLAKFYGLPGVNGDDFRKVSLAGMPRRGVLTHGSVLTLTSNPTRTSPVKRGKWVLENLLGTPPPPPPPDVPELEADGRPLTGSLREQMQQHSRNATCASCHARMDPIGFGLEHFNAIGGWREQEGGVAVDASGRFSGGEEFNGAGELAVLLARRRADDFRRCLAEKLLTYALGRGVEYYDRPAVDTIRRALREGDDRFSALILAVAQSFPFQHRRAAAQTTITTNP